jgi:hypothetical protein
MLFHVTPEDHIRVMNEDGPTDRNPRDSTFASEKELQELINEWPMKRLVEIWNRLPGLEPVARFTDLIEPARSHGPCSAGNASAVLARAESTDALTTAFSRVTSLAPVGRAFHSTRSTNPRFRYPTQLLSQAFIATLQASGPN